MLPSFRVNQHTFQRAHILEASRQADTHGELHRKACDVTGKLGSLYDTKTDSFIKHHPLLREPSWYIKNVTPTCYWWSSHKNNESEIPADKLDIEDELCLSLYLGLCGDKLNGRASLINYEQPIDHRTIFLFYSYRTREQFLPTDSFLASTFFPNGTFDELNVDGSHIVHGIIWGFEVLFAIQIPNTIEVMGDGSDITRLFNKIRDILKQNSSLPIRLTDDEQNLWSKLSVQILETSPHLSFDQVTHIQSIIYRIQRFQCYWRYYEYPLVYILQPVKWIYHTASDVDDQCSENGFPKELKQIQRHLYLLQNKLNRLTLSLRLLQEADKEKFLLLQFTDIKNEFHQLEEKRRELLQNLISILIDVRHGKQDLHMLLKIIEEHQYDSLRLSAIDPLIEKCEGLYNKTLLINQLRQENFDYLQITDDQTSSKKEQILKLFGNSIHTIHVLCSSDVLMKRNKTLWNSYRQELIKKRNEDSTVRLIYADLSYCKHEDVKETIIISCSSQTTKPISSPIQQIPEKKDINVLLLGESGVGKSTFINAFVNYLTFDSLEQAVTGEPVVLIPVSFLITVTDKLEEFVVKFGDVDVNEDHNHSGQSVTQYCRSYVFDINIILRLRLFDTPGIGDTRGLDQDQKNIDRILSYINNFTHINAVCILLQPNIIRLNAFFRSCVIQLFTYLTPAARDNIVFCFTNTRATFFAPGNTAPLLKSFLKELPISDIPFSRKNSFCFDSESFRYLAAVKNNVEFNEHQRQECHKSWTGSVTESERLLKFICTLKPYYIAEWHSAKHAKIEINQMIRPIMEAFRTVLFNMILQKQSENHIQVVLNPKPIVDPRTVSAICYRGNCDPTRIQCNNFFIPQYTVHQFNCTTTELNAECVSCQCAMGAHLFIDYELNYEVVSIIEPAKPIDDETINQWLQLCNKFANFLNSNEMFFLYLDQFIDEEHLLKIAEKSLDGSKYMANSRLYDILLSIKSTFETYISMENAENEPDLNEIYEWIKSAKSLSDIKSQLAAIKEGQLKLLESQERIVQIPSQCTGILARIAEQSIH